MGCDIHVFPERRDADGRFHHVPNGELLDLRNYARFSFLAGVRNTANIIPLSSARGLPDDMSTHVRHEFEEWGDDGHTRSWLSLRELLEFDYDQPLAFRDGGRDSRCTEATYRELLDEDFFIELRELKALDVKRLVFWFDN